MSKFVCFLAGVLLSATLAIIPIRIELSKIEEQKTVHGEREYYRGLLTAVVHSKQKAYTGPRDDNGCFPLEANDAYQDTIMEYQFTEADLEQTFDSMFCFGYLVPWGFEP